MAATPLPPGEAQPIRKSVRRLRWFVQTFRAQMTQVEADTGIVFDLDAGRLSAAFLAWLRAFDAQRPGDPADRRRYTGFAAGLMLRTLLEHAPVRVANPEQTGSADIPQHFWPEGYLYVTYCLNVRSAVLEQDFHEKQRDVPELRDLRTWWSFRENTEQDRGAAIGFLDLFAGETPDWSMPGLFRSGDAQSRALEDARALVARLNKPDPEQD